MITRVTTAVRDISCAAARLLELLPTLLAGQLRLSRLFGLFIVFIVLRLI
jgi:hypothetical protein